MLRKFTAIALLCLCAFPAVAADPAAPSEAAFIRDALIKQGLEQGLDKSPELEKLVTEYRNDQLSRLALEASRDKGMPDFTARAEEIYQARLDTQYTLPLRLRVRVLEMNLPTGKETEIQDKLKAIRAEVVAGKVDFKAAVIANSNTTELSLTQGDSQWFKKGDKPDLFFEKAEQLSVDKPLSEVFIHQKTVYLLSFIDRKEPEIRQFDAVKPEIIAELQKEYREDHEKMVLDALREAFTAQKSAM
ncbi:peptidylprolyl isomerase [Thiothrix lacustris]|uniref:Peptidylprolyl isomerase n=1 Tax=Thiothrix lacustris TaxID=525917 RepID=A0ABY9MN97_9GAMM|nr:peptidylprolyl isomerase [Thiothrix lacustris]WML89685.1 peptidylprolyl isomerase [Thiothrix lacustris]